jgi:hypothetical protein
VKFSLTSAGTKIPGQVKSAFVSLGCTTQVGLSKTNTIASVSDSPVITTGTVSTTAGTVATASNSTAQVQGANLLGGVITADEIEADSTTSQVSGSLQTSAAGSMFTNLVVAGNAITGTPAPNTVIPLAGFGSVTLNEQIVVTESTSAQLTVNMIHINTFRFIGHAHPKPPRLTRRQVAALAQNYCCTSRRTLGAAVAR